jgi:DNA-binding MarR family transcriptional regulator
MLLASQGQSTHPIQGKRPWRRRLVSLTPKSRALVTRMAPQIEAAYQRIEGELGADCIERCYAVLDEMLQAISADEDSA